MMKQLDYCQQNRSNLLTKDAMGKHIQSIDNALLRRVYARGRGSVFTAAEFLDLGSRGAIHQALSRNVRSGAIRKLARGLYDYPVQDPQLGNLAPRAQEIARALAGRDAVRLQPTGANAANMLGLSTQVPARVIYLTDGASRKVQIGRLEVVLKKTTPRQMATAGRISGTVIQALRWLGKDSVNDSTLTLLRRKLSADDKRRVLEDARFAPSWIAKVMKQIAEPIEN